MVLSRGNTEELGKLYETWRGKPPTIDAMMKYRDLRQ
jgi:peptidyl-dipeptidase Dcp